MIEKISTSCPPLIAGMNMRFFWCRMRLSTTPVLSDGGGVASVASSGSGVFTVTFVEALPDSVILVQAMERAAGGHGMVKLTSLNAARTVATIEIYLANSATAPTLADGATTDFAHMLFLFVGR
jgi:hypothetical protein